MKSHFVKLLAALVAGGTMLVTAPAHADRDDRGWRHDRKEWRDHDRGRHYGHYKKHRERERVVIRERIIERRPVVKEYHYYDQPSRHYGPAYPIYSRDPAVIIGVQVPPIVIPLR